MNSANQNVDENIQNIDIDDIKDDKEIERYSSQLVNFYQNYDFLLRQLSKKFDIRDYKAIPKRKLNDIILKKVEEYSKDSSKIQETIKQLLESQLTEGRQNLAAKIQRLEEDLVKANDDKQKFEQENQNLQQRVQTLENEIEASKQNLRFSLNELKLHMENKPQIFSQTELDHLTSDLALHQPPAKDIEFITFNQIEKKILIQYRMDPNIELPPPRDEEEVIPKQFFDQLWNIFSDLCAKISQQNEATVSLVEKLANFIQNENNQEGSNIEAVKNSVTQKKDLLNQLLAAKPDHYSFSEIQNRIEELERRNLLECDSINNPTFEIYQRLLDKNKEIISNYEQIILQYIQRE